MDTHRRVAEAERAATGAGIDLDLRLAHLRAAIQASVESGHAGALDTAAIKRAGQDIAVGQRLGVAREHFTVPESIDVWNHEVARLFNGA